MNKIADLRKEYMLHTLDEKDVQKDPFDQFRLWFDEAVRADVPEPNAFTLSTADSRGIPSARVVLLKGIEQGGFSFYTNYDSAKAGELATNPYVSMTFLWLELERQVRIKGVATRLSREDSEQYFQSRPRESRIGAWASRQSSVIPDRKFLENKMQALMTEFEGQEHIPLPDSWGGYLITPNSFEFWQGRANRLHDRIRYRLGDTEWIIERLSP
jgi:pyridoxamine 5'-phosphate oxidase